MNLWTTPSTPFMAHSPTREKTRLPSFPYIVDSDFESARNELLVGDEEAYREGLVADPDVPRKLLSMSGYGKSRYTNERDLETNRAMENPLYLAYEQAGTHVPGLPPNTSMNLHHDPIINRNTSTTYAAGSLFSARSNESRPTNYPFLQRRNIPQITNWHPTQGPEGTRVLFYLTSAFELDGSWSFQARFGDQRVECDLANLPDQDGFFQYVLSTYAPPLSTASWGSEDVPLLLQAQDAAGNTEGPMRAGTFRYTDSISQPARESSDSSRKRKLSADTLTATTQPRKSGFEQQQHSQHNSSNSARYDGQNYHYENTPYITTPPPLGATTSSTVGLSHYHNPEELGLQFQDEHTRSTGSLVPVDAGLQYKRPSPQTPSWHTPSGPPPNARSPNLSASSSRGHGVESPATAEPRLVRTSELHGSPSPSSTPNGIPPPGPFNPYALYPQHKASLKLEGDLEDMTKDWSVDEINKQRRLVHFQRSQSGSVIAATFNAVAPDEPPAPNPQALTISCIWWETKQECYVTSVDTIALLECLIYAKFTVEEKNRIRRNLEGFKPLTVAKGKDSDDFFKLIMAFPNPKPRNIEKDVKAFPWRILDLALKKIISKYSASYSSTASAMQPVAAANYRIGYHPELGQEPGHPASSYSEAPINAPYGHIMPNSAHNTAQNSRLPLSYSSNVSPALAYSAHTEEYPLYQHPTSQHGQNSGLLPAMTSSQHQQDSQSQQPRSTWDYSTYLDPSVSDVGHQALYALPAGQTHGQYSAA